VGSVGAINSFIIGAALGLRAGLQFPLRTASARGIKTRLRAIRQQRFPCVYNRRFHRNRCAHYIKTAAEINRHAREIIDLSRHI
jgi:hypothetical protein